MRVSRWVPPLPGMTPRLISGRPSRAERAAMRSVQASAISRPAPRAMAVDAGERRQAHGFQQARKLAAQAGPGGKLARDRALLQFVDVGAGGKGPVAGPDEDHAVRLAAVLQGAQGVHALLPHRQAHGVAPLRVGEGDGRDALRDIDRDPGVGRHGLSFPGFRPMPMPLPAGWPRVRRGPSCRWRSWGSPPSPRAAGVS